MRRGAWRAPRGDTKPDPRQVSTAALRLYGHPSMGQSGVAVQSRSRMRQAISPSPFHFMYWLEPALAARTSRTVNEHLAGIVQAHPDRFVALGHVPLQAADAAATELEYCVKRLGFRGCEIGTNIAGAAVSRGREHKAAIDLGAGIGLPPQLDAPFAESPYDRLGAFLLAARREHGDNQGGAGCNMARA